MKASPASKASATQASTSARSPPTLAVPQSRADSPANWRRSSSSWHWLAQASAARASGSRQLRRAVTISSTLTRFPTTGKLGLFHRDGPALVIAPATADAQVTSRKSLETKARALHQLNRALVA